MDFYRVTEGRLTIVLVAVATNELKSAVRSRSRGAIELLFVRQSFLATA